MDKLIEVTGNIASVTDVLICGVSGILRIAREFYILDYEVMTLFVGGIALMVMGILVKVHSDKFYLKYIMPVRENES